MAPPASRLTRARLLLVAFAGIVAGVGASSAIGWGGYQMPIEVLAVTKLVEVAVGWSFVGVGLIAWWRRPDDRSGVLMVLLGFAWLLRLIGAVATPWASAVGIILGSLPFALLVHLLVTFPGGRITTRPQRWLIGAGYLVTAPLAALQLLLEPNLALTAPPGLLVADQLELVVEVGPAQQISQVTVAAVLVAAAVLVVHQWFAAGPARRRTTALTVWGGVLIAATVAANYLDVFGHLPSLTPTVLAWPARIVLLVWPVALLVGVLRGRLDESAVGGLVLELGSGLPIPNRLQAVVAATLHDPTARLAYWIPAFGSFVDATGHPVSLTTPEPRRAVSYLQRDGEPIAALEHDAVLGADSPLVAGVMAGVGLAVENERLQVEVRTQLAEVVASRSRIVDAVDAARRRIERELRQGVYQQLTTVAAHIDGFWMELDGAPVPSLVRSLDELNADLMTALEELRTLARGIYPVLLSDAGLGPALAALVERSAVAATLVAEPRQRFPEPVERTAYFVVLEALDNADRHAAAGTVSVAVRVSGSDLVLEVIDDGRGGADPGGPGLREIADRIAVLGGTLVVDSPPDRGTRVRALLPLGDPVDVTAHQFADKGFPDPHAGADLVARPAVAGDA